MNREIENESDRASDAAATPASAGLLVGGGNGGGIDISRMRFECRWQNCGKVFRRPSDLTKHERYHVKEYLCDQPGCEKAFATQKDLRRHQRTHGTPDGVAAAGYRCRVPGCRKARTGHVYNRRDNFVRHLRTKHAGMDFDVREDYDVTY
ncbi:hypothetical protein CPLU01_08223 [Colletotrichum plurivorum]|uniref:C2H2-type domain-containing protein n=1 Tax=Colletotrichum plurivorum TaxID=2175906 RepID=A0A8H6KC22_9PEZI|nr:hypothetical protein CPLU01_08223 [Colletotrichum plurivorum]